MNTYKIKFFGSKNKREQIRQIKMEIDSPSREEIKSILKYKYGYEVVNGLKIRDI